MNEAKNKGVCVRRRKGRQRGAFLIEAILALGVAVSLIGMTANFLADEKAKQENILLASETEVILAAARAYVSQNYRDLREQLYDAADTGAAGEAILTVTLDDLVDAGYLPAGFNDGGIFGRLYDQQFAIIARGVLRDDSDNPKSTLTFAMLDDGGTIAAALADGDTTNDEMEIESFLVTHGGRAMELGVGSNVVARMQTSFGGFVSEEGITRGPYANFTLDITPFEDLPEYPEAGRLANVVSLSNFGVLGADGELSEDIENDFFHRCRGLTVGSAAADACTDPNSNAVYNDLALAPWDADLDGTVDSFPAITGLANVKCALEEGADLDASEAPVDSSQAAEINELLIDCRTTRLNGSLGVLEDISATGDILAAGNLLAGEGRFQATGTRIFLSTDLANPDALAIRKGNENYLVGDHVVIGNVTNDADGTVTGKDLGETITDARIVRPNIDGSASTAEQDDNWVAKPTCPSTALDGTTPMAPRIYTTPSVYADDQGRPIVGVETYAVDAPGDPTRWKVEMYLYVDEDADSDLNADRIEVMPELGGVLVQTRCY